MARYLFHRRHEPDECEVVFTSFKGRGSPVRHRPTLASCRTGGHAIWWTVEAGSEGDVRRRLCGRRRSRRRPHKAEPGGTPSA